MERYQMPEMEVIVMPTQDVVTISLPTDEW